ncbi:helix-turn-helix domain-containing protein [Streptomyces sp. NPDC096142]|uniref:helix-turn-helix domain-containing protein n=1 Tax=Streptomyces sp. NPDC096142 TaxID=3366077 RepID=UPI0038127DAD
MHQDTDGTRPQAAGAPLLDSRVELREFLRTRRARLKPEDVGLASYGTTRRRVQGLRREELAMLAGVSVAYYTRLEQGNGRNVSVEVLDAIAVALQLDEAEHAHLVHLVRPTTRRGTRRGHRPAPAREGLQQLVDAMEASPAYIAGARSEILVWNRTAAAVFGDWGALPPAERNWARLVFLSPAYRDLLVDWERKAGDIVSHLHLYAGQHPKDPDLSTLVGDLSVRSADFRRLWATHNVKDKSHGVKRLRHPLVGELTLSFESLLLPENREQYLCVYTAKAGSPSAEALRLLTSWGPDEANTSPHAGRF